MGPARCSAGRTPAGRPGSSSGVPGSTWSWLPVAFLVVILPQTDAGAPISSRSIPLNLRRSHQSLIGWNAAAPTMSSATTTHTPTIGEAAAPLGALLLVADLVDDRLTVGLVLLGHGLVSLGSEDRAGGRRCGRVYGVTGDADRTRRTDRRRRLPPVRERRPRRPSVGRTRGGRRQRGRPPVVGPGSAPQSRLEQRRRAPSAGTGDAEGRPVLGGVAASARTTASRAP